MTSPRKGPPRRKEAESEAHLDRKLDDALEGTFPASDPVELTPQPGDEAPEDPDEEGSEAAAE